MDHIYRTTSVIISSTFDTSDVFSVAVINRRATGAGYTKLKRKTKLPITLASTTINITDNYFGDIIDWL